MHTFNVDRIAAAAAKGRYNPTADEIRSAVERPQTDPYYAVNCADAWADHRGDDPEELYCGHGRACDCVDLTAENIGPNGDTQCRDCAAVDDAESLAFERENADYM